MAIVSIVVAAFAGWLCGAAWYMGLSGPWVRASGVKVGEDGKPVNGSDPIPFILSLVSNLVVATMLRHLLVQGGVNQWHGGLVAGLGVGLFFITPWIFLNNAYAFRPYALSVIDSGYAILACSMMGFVLALFL